MTTAPTPAVSVVVAVRDGQRTVAACLDSLRALRYPAERLELIAVDNGSRDGTRAILERYRPCLRIVDEPVPGPAAARNRGIDEARYELVAFTDADCRVDADWLRHLVAPLADESVGVAGGRILAIDRSNPIERFGESLHDHERAMSGFRNPYAITMSWASRADVLRGSGLFDVSFLRGEDTELAYRLVFAGYRLVYVPEAIVYHHNRSTLRGLARQGFQSGYWSVAVARKHGARLRPGAPLANRQPRPGPPGASRGLLPSLRGAVAGRGDDRYSFLFQLGRKLGRAAGSIRFRDSTGSRDA